MDNLEFKQAMDCTKSLLTAKPQFPDVIYPYKEGAKNIKIVGVFTEFFINQDKGCPVKKCEVL